MSAQYAEKIKNAITLANALIAAAWNQPLLGKRMSRLCNRCLRLVNKLEGNYSDARPPGMV